MTSYHASIPTRSFRRMTHSPLPIVGALFFVFALSPAVFQLEKWILDKVDTFFSKTSSIEQRRENGANSAQGKLVRVSVELFRDSSVRLVRLNLPKQVLNYRLSANGRFQNDLGKAVNESHVAMLAVSRNAKAVLERESVGFVDPMHLPPSLKNTFTLPFQVAALSNYVLIPDVTRLARGVTLFQGIPRW